MSLYSCFSANDDLFDTIQRDIVRECKYKLPAPYPTPLATHTWIERRTDHEYRGIESVPPWCREFDPAEKKGQVVRRYLVACTPEQEEIIWRAAKRDLHTPYDFLGLLVVGFYCFSNRPDRFYESHHAALFCSESEAKWLRAGTLPVLPDLPLDNIFPALLESYISSVFEKVIVDNLKPQAAA